MTHIYFCAGVCVCVWECVYVCGSGVCVGVSVVCECVVCVSGVCVCTVLMCVGLEWLACVFLCYCVLLWPVG